MPSRTALLLAFAITIPAWAAPPDRLDELQVEIGRLRAHLVAVDGLVRARETTLAEMTQALKRINDDVTTLKAPAPQPMAGPFLSGPPASSDNAGVAKVAVFAPRLEVDSTRRHDTVFVKLKRIESDHVKLVAEVELSQDGTGVELPLDKSGALYVAEWVTSDGQSYNLLLKDGASAQTAASVQVKQLQAQGRLIFVGYRLD